MFDQFGMLERCSLRPGYVHSADDCQSVLKPVIARYSGRNLQRFFQGDAAIGIPEL